MELPHADEDGIRSRLPAQGGSHQLELRRLPPFTLGRLHHGRANSRMLGSGTGRFSGSGF
jgi:hypothetical protein